MNDNTFKDEACAPIPGAIIGREIIFFSTTSSTNDAAIEIGKQRDNPEGIVVIADEQTGGKGRFGRKWESPHGVNLLFTVLLKPKLTPQQVSLITLVAAIAVTHAIRKLTGVTAGIKWPNDILINGKKTGGILTEIKACANQIDILAIGIGVNVNMTPDMMGKEIRTLATSLKIEKGTSLNRAVLFRAILAELETYYKILLRGDSVTLIQEWLSLNSTIGNTVSVRNQDSVITGVAEGINESGELLLKLESGETKTIYAGDVTILKKGSEDPRG